MLTLRSSLTIGCALFLGLGCSQGNAPLTTTSGSSTGAGTSNTATSTSTTGSSSGSTGASSTSGGTTGATAGTTGTTSGGTTGVPDAGCSASGGAELTACVHGSDCQCPAWCIDDTALGPYLFPPTKLCELPCQTSADCVTAYEVCRDGFCSPNFCAVALPDGGSDVGAGAWQVCNAADAGDGTCAFTTTGLGSLNTLLSGFNCVQGGQATDACDPTATRANPENLCPAGLSCLQLPDGGAGCLHGCDRTVTPDLCPNGTACAGSYATSHFGVCYPVGDGGCASGLAATVGMSCTRALDCGCPQQCATDPGIGVAICQDPCTGASDCSLDNVHCVSGLCQMNFCVSDELGNPAPGAFGAICTVDDGGPGTCIASAGLSIDAQNPEFGFCVRPGAGVACQPPLVPTPIFVPSNPGLVLTVDQLCPELSLCVNGGCATVCDPLSDAGAVDCIAGQVCLEHDGDPVTHLGYCGTCLPAGSFCSVPGECCGSCVGSTCQ